MQTNHHHLLRFYTYNCQCWYMPLTENRMGWMIIQDIRGQSKEGAQGLSAWGADAAMDICDRVRHFRCPYTGTFGDMIDRTPKDLISKVMLEDKVRIDQPRAASKNTSAWILMIRFASWFVVLSHLVEWTNCFARRW